MIILLIAVMFAQGSSLRLVDIEVNSVVQKGDPVWLNCTFDQESEDLYSVKWYKNSVEIYRYLPKEHPQAQSYEQPGVYIDMDRSSVGHVYLQKTDLESEGIYRCEVSAEAPSFQTERGEKELRIYVLPRETPTVTGTHDHYSVGDLVNVTCSAKPSKPAAYLQWYINDKKAPVHFEWPLSPLKEGRLLGSRLGLRFVVKHAHLWHGTLNLRCSSVIAQEYSRSVEELYIKDMPKSSELRSAKDGPRINGQKSTYRLGESVVANCTSPKVKEAPKLRWFLNENEVLPEYVTRYPLVEHPDGLESTLLGIHFNVREHHFRNGEMRLNCTAIFKKIVDTSHVETVIGASQQSSGLQVSAKGGSGSGSTCSSGKSLELLFTILLSVWFIYC
ncbi:uncharacterized protein LOC143235866 [Tachypleus tridentatus]|uniref:uncharacterized protein LOC143235866 n=1 Tax=Tachypleus tridentatus TaxID=6853 RepID=UPI003FCF7F2C